MQFFLKEDPASYRFLMEWHNDEDKFEDPVVI
jgi:hypothetical protein